MCKILFDKIIVRFNRLSEKLGNSLQEGEVNKDNSVVQKQEKETAFCEPQQQTESVRQQSKPEAQDDTKKTKQQKEEAKQLDSKDKLPQKVVDTLKKEVEYSDIMKGKSLKIWLDCSPLAYNNYNTETYRQHILSYLSNEKGFGFDQIIFNIGKPAPELHATRIGDSDLEYLQVVETEVSQKVVSYKAEITIYGDAGSLLQDKYILSSEDMKKRMISAYNIGAGHFPKIPSGYRENHIAIDDNPESPMVEKNKYVSRMHAHIGCSEIFGFFLQAELDGTRLVGKRTRIFRGEQKIEMDNPQVKEPLQDGDLIELGKAVVLRYVEIND